MELITKVSAAAICASVLSLLVKKTNPELSVLMSLAVISVIVFAGLSAAEGVVALELLPRQIVLLEFSGF